MISYNDLVYFNELTQTLNFSRAAERIGISQPSLSAAIKRLEYFIGTELFIRNKHKVILTQAGKNLLSHNKQLLQLWEMTKAKCFASTKEVHGSITLGCHLSIAFYFLPRFLPALMEKYPRLEIKLKHDLSRKITEEIINYTIDIGIVVNPIKHPDLIIKKIFDDEMTCWQSSLSPYNDITIICDPDLNQTQWILKKLKKKLAKPSRMISSSNLEVIANLTAAGAGMGILPARVANALHVLRLVKMANAPAYHDEICLSYRHENRNVKAVQAIVQEIKMIKNF